MTVFKNVIYLRFLTISHFLRKHKTIHYRLLTLQNNDLGKSTRKKKGVAYALSFQRLYTVDEYTANV
jgi:hypothetical protein